ncbi:MAG: 3-deoxy-D-manno-octulosonic acid transferase [Bacteroidetes bacterium HGW-Bacteroidetes-13]|jgi:3-deoxy-D-manno-octulosonic-acid transferase|nr:MAG: 3-deoxy-D-manno-octulosonic acid transferase [Bacteroidetes bacterium HGW-Bacteroidetes-13]
MYLIYQFLSQVAFLGIRLAAIFNPKLQLFVAGRRNSFDILQAKIEPSDRVIWFHVASLGEYEQGLPLLKKTRDAFPSHKIVLTFFSPSGYEVVKDKTPAAAVLYLPFDTFSNAKRFLDLAHPEWVVFVKYEFWPIYLKTLRDRKIKTLIVSAIFRPSQAFFKPYGGWMRKSLRTFNHFFVQNETSKDLLSSIGFENVTVSGDTRFDRVGEILQRDNSLDFLRKFKADQTCLVAGSTWPEDEALLVKYINQNKAKKQKYVLVPHNIKQDSILILREKIELPTVLYSEISDKNPADFSVLIVDAIGLLTKIYAQADLAYVGGGMATGLHNVLEPAVFGIPVVIGKYYDKFEEAKQLVACGGVISVSNQNELNEALNGLFNDVGKRAKQGNINNTFIGEKLGATSLIMDYILSMTRK